MKNLLAFAMCTVNKVMVVVVKPFIDLVFKRQFEGEHGMFLKWKADSPMLTIGYGWTLENIVVVVEKQENKVDIQFKVHSRLELNAHDRVSAMHWMSSNILFAKVDKQRYYLLDTTKFQSLQTSQEQASFMPLDEQSKKHTLQQSVITEDHFPCEVADLRISSHPPFYGYTIVSSQNNLFFLESLY